MFLNPLMLFGAAAIGIPIIIHLLNRRKFERVPWAAMRFLRASIEQNQKRIRVEDVLLLILRCMMLLLLAVALARPVLRATAAAVGGLNKVTAVIVLDNSASMAQTDGVESRLGSAKKAAEQVIRGLPTGSSAAVLLASDQFLPVIAEPSFDMASVSHQLNDAPVHDRPSNLLPAVREALSILERKSELRKELYVITDGQASAFREMPALRKLLDENRRDVRPHVLLVGAPEDRNLAVTSVALDTGVVPVNEPVRVNVVVRNHGKAEARNVPVAIAVDADKPMDQATIAAIGPGASAGVSLFARLRSEGFHTITARIDGDRFPADDWRTVALRVVKEVKVLLIDGESGAGGRESEIFYLRNALRPVPRPQWGDYHVKLTVRQPTELEAIRLEDFDAVFAANVADVSPGVVNQLASFVRTGRGLAVFAGGNVNGRFYNENLVQRLHLLPASFGPAFGIARPADPDRNPASGFALKGRPHEHPLLSLWNDAGNGNLALVRFYRALELTPDSTPPPPQAPPSGSWSLPRIVASFADGKPFLVERDFGRGRVLQFASTADSEWTDFPTAANGGHYVPLLQRALGHLVSRQDEHLTLRAGQPFVHTAAAEAVNESALISKPPRHFSSLPPDAMEVRESQRVSLEEDGLPRLKFDRTHFAGPYEVKIGTAAPVRFAVQLDPDESDLSPLDAEQSRLLDEVAHVVRWTPGTDLGAQLEEGRVGTELWPYIIPIVLLLATMETFLAHFFSKSK